MNPQEHQPKYDLYIVDEETLGRTCPECQKVYAGRSQVLRHLREAHHEHRNSFFMLSNRIDVKERYMHKCLEGCDHSFRYNRDLRDHLIHFHGFHIKEKIKKFPSYEDFQRWFIRMQETGSQSFVRKQESKTNRSGSAKVSYYYCHRSGNQKLKSGERKRKLKQHGSCKINSGCTSYLKSIEYDNTCVVTYCDFHYGHKTELEHLPLPVQARSKIIEHLEQGAKLVRINLEDVGNAIQLENIPRSKILTKADIKTLKNFTRKERKVLPKVSLRNIDVLEPEITYSNEDENNGECEVITIISENNISENRLTEQCTFSPSETEDFSLEDSEEPVPEDMKIEESVLEVDQTNEANNEEATIDVDPSEVIATEYFEDEESEEDMYGHYVAEMLKQIDYSDRAMARNQMNKILKHFYSKAKKAEQSSIS